MLRLDGVVKTFGDKRAVDGVSLVVPKGQLVGVSRVRASRPCCA